MIKLVFGERIKFVGRRPETIEGLRLACGKVFGMIGSEVVLKKDALHEVVDNPEEAEVEEMREPDERDRNVMAAMNFNYVDP